MEIFNLRADDITLNATGETRIDRSRIENNVNSGTIADNSNIRITTGSFILTNESELSTSNLGSGESDIENPRVAGDITLDASGQIAIDGGASIFSTGFFGRVFLTSANGSININNASIRATGENDIANSENSRFSLINLTAPQGSVFLDGAELEVSNSGIGFAGDIKLNARELVEIKNGSAISSNGNRGRILVGETTSPKIFQLDNSTLNTTNEGVSIEDFPDTQINAGDISIDATENISLENTSEIISSTERLGNAGNIFLTTNGSLNFSNGNLFSNVRAGGRGRAGDIAIKAGSLSISSNAQIQSGVLEALGDRQAGRGNDISQVIIDVRDDVRILRSGIFTDVESGASGNASNIKITSQAGSIF